jgi:cell division protein FtsZ
MPVFDVPAEPEETPAPEPLLGFESEAPAEIAVPPSPPSSFRRAVAVSATAAEVPSLFDYGRPFAEPEITARENAAIVSESAPELGQVDEPALDPGIEGEPPDEAEVPAVVIAEFVSAAAEEVLEGYVDADPDPEPIEGEEGFDIPDLESSGFTPIPRKRPPGVTPWSAGKSPKLPVIDGHEDWQNPAPAVVEPESPKLKLGVKATKPQSELSLDSTPRGRFEGENPNVFDGEDLDLPPFLRKKK